MKEEKAKNKIRRLTKEIYDLQKQMREILSFYQASSKGTKDFPENKNPHPEGSDNYKAYESGFEKALMIVQLNALKETSKLIVKYLADHYDLTDNDLEIIYALDKEKIEDLIEFSKKTLTVSINLEEELEKIWTTLSKPSEDITKTEHSNIITL